MCAGHATHACVFSACPTRHSSHRFEHVGEERVRPDDDGSWAVEPSGVKGEECGACMKHFVHIGPRFVLCESRRAQSAKLLTLGSIRLPSGSHIVFASTYPKYSSRRRHNLAELELPHLWKYQVAGPSRTTNGHSVSLLCARSTLAATAPAPRKRARHGQRRGDRSASSWRGCSLQPSQQQQRRNCMLHSTLTTRSGQRCGTRSCPPWSASRVCWLGSGRSAMASKLSRLVQLEHKHETSSARYEKCPALWPHTSISATSNGAMDIRTEFIDSTNSVCT